MPGGLEEFIDIKIKEALLDKNVRAIMVIGGSDTGKTTLVEGLADFLSKHAATGVVDLDMGQSHIGPPTTIGWGRLFGGFKGWGDIGIEDMYFTGTISPPGNLLPTIVGARRIVDKAKEKCDKLVLDTTGLIDGPVGRVLKQYKIDILSPDVIIALERGGELGGILDPYRFQKRHIVCRISVPESVTLKSLAKRADYRAVKFREYFSSSEVMEVSSHSAGVRFTGDAMDKGLIGRIVSLRDEMQEDRALGIIEEADLRSGRFLIRSPIKNPRFATLVIGTASVTL